MKYLCYPIYLIEFMSISDRLYLSCYTRFKRTGRGKVVVRLIVLKEYREWQNEEKIRLSDRWFESDRLFTTYDGHPIHPDSITSWFTEFVKRQGLPKVTVHSLRHTNITLMIMAGVPLRTVARRAGHASTATTSVIYSHAIQTADELASEVLDDLLKPQVGGKRQVG